MLQESYETTGCENCKINFIECDLMNEGNLINHADSTDSTNCQQSRLENERREINNFKKKSIKRNEGTSNSIISSKSQEVKFKDPEYKSMDNLSCNEIKQKHSPILDFDYCNHDPITLSFPLDSRSFNSNLNEQISFVDESFLKEKFNFNTTVKTPLNTNIRFVGPIDPHAVFAQFNTSLGKIRKRRCGNGNVYKEANSLVFRADEAKDLDVIDVEKGNAPYIAAYSPNPVKRSRSTQQILSSSRIKNKRIKLTGVNFKNIKGSEDSPAYLNEVAKEANLASDTSMGVYINDLVTHLPKSGCSSAHLGYLREIGAFELGLSSNTCYMLCKTYIYKVNCIFPIIYEDLFWENYKKNKILTVLLYSIILIASRDDTAIKYLNNEGVENLGIWLDGLELKIRGLLQAEIEIDRLTLLQVRLLLHLHSRNCPTGFERASTDLSIALSYAITLGLQHKQKFVDSSCQMLDTEYSQYIYPSLKARSKHLCKLWWIIVIFDRMNAIFNSRTMLVNKRDSSVDIPKDDGCFLKLIECANYIERSLSIFQPNGDHRIIPNEGVINIEDDSDFSFTDQTSSTSKEINMDEFNVELYAERATDNLVNLLQSAIIILLQRRYYSDNHTANSIPDHNNSIASFRILGIIKNNYDYLPNIPFIPYSLSLAMTIFLRIGLKSIVTNVQKNDLNLSYKYNLQDALELMQIFQKKWWYAERMYTLGSCLFIKINSDNKNLDLNQSCLNSQEKKSGIESIQGEILSPLGFYLEDPDFIEFSNNSTNNLDIELLLEILNYGYDYD